MQDSISLRRFPGRCSESYFPFCSEKPQSGESCNLPPKKAQQTESWWPGAVRHLRDLLTIYLALLELEILESKHQQMVKGSGKSAFSKLDFAKMLIKFLNNPQAYCWRQGLREKRAHMIDSRALQPRGFVDQRLSLHLPRAGLSYSNFYFQ